MKKQFRNTQEPKKKKSVIQKPKAGKIQSVPETRQVDSNQVDQKSQRNALGDQEYPKPGRQEPSEQKRGKSTASARGLDRPPEVKSGQVLQKSSTQAKKSTKET